MMASVRHNPQPVNPESPNPDPVPGYDCPQEFKQVRELVARGIRALGSRESSPARQRTADDEQQVHEEHEARGRGCVQ